MGDNVGKIVKRATIIEMILGVCITVASNVAINLSNYISYYLTGIVGASVILAGSFITIFRIWDALTDLGIGVITDRTNTRIGRFRPYILIGTIATILSGYALIYIPFYVNEKARLPIFIVLYMIFVVATTILNVSVRVTPQVLTDDYKQRATIGMLTGIALTVLFSGVPILVYSHIMPITKGFNMEFFKMLWNYFAVATLVLGFLAFLGFSKKDKKLDEAEMAIKNKEKVNIKDIINVIKHNQPLQMLILSAGTDKLATVCQSNATIVVIIYAIVAGNSKFGSAINSYTMIPCVVMILLGLGAIGRKFGAKRSLVISTIGGLVVSILSILLWIFGNPTTLSFPGYEGFTSWTFFTVSFLGLWCLMKGFSMVGTNSLSPMIADVIDYEEYVSGKYCPALVGSIFNLADKIISSLGPTIIAVLCACIGFRNELPTIDTPYSHSLFAIGLMGMYGLIIIGYIVNLIAMKFYDLTPERMQEIRDELDLRKSQQIENQKVIS